MPQALTAPVPRPSSGRRAYALRSIVVLVLVAGYLPFAPVRLFDLRAFYCAGQAVATGADPYREHPLRECERATTAPGVSADADDVTVPAPLPGYALAPFVLLARLPFFTCMLVWIAASLAALWATVVLLSRVLDAPLPAIAVAVCLPAALVAVPLGQTAPFVGLAIAACAHELVAGRPRRAAAAALVTAFDPAIALVLCATLVITVPKTRATLIAGTLLLGALSLAVLGVDLNVEYLRGVLQEHAAGSVAERSQFSTTHFAWVAGFGHAAALGLGKAWFAGAALIGIAVARRLRATSGLAALALVPPAFAVFGGMYVHFSQLALAIPAFLMVAGAGPAARPWLSSAIFVLAVPWIALAAFPPFALALVALATIYAGTPAGATTGLRLGVGSALLLAVFFGVAALTIHPDAAPFALSIERNPLVDVGWNRYVAWRDPRPNWTFVLLQVPTILAFGACLAGVARAGLTKLAPPLPSRSV